MNLNFFQNRLPSNVQRVCLPSIQSLLMFCLGCLASNVAQASDQHWDPETYLQVPVQLGSDTRLVMPEPFDDAWERDAEVACTLLDEHTLIIRPKVNNIEQRLTLRGHQSGTLYLARVSSSLPFSPVITVHHEPDSENGHTKTPSVLGLLNAMLQDSAPAGFELWQSQRVLLSQHGLKLTAQQVWRGSQLSGIAADLSLQDGETSFAVIPAQFSVRIPELGLLRALSSDTDTLSSKHPSAKVFLVYSHDPHSHP